LLLHYLKVLSLLSLCAAIAADVADHQLKPGLFCLFVAGFSQWFSAWAAHQITQGDFSKLRP
jgi:cytosine/uracil/thiamine/allantoin permease